MSSIDPPNNTGNGTNNGNVVDENAGLDPKVLGPAIAVPIAFVAVGVFLLIFFIRKRKNKRANAENMTTFNPTAIQPGEIDKRMHIPYKSLVLKDEIGSGSYGKVFVGLVLLILKHALYY